MAVFDSGVSCITYYTADITIARVGSLYGTVVQTAVNTGIVCIGRNTSHILRCAINGSAVGTILYLYHMRGVAIVVATNTTHIRRVVCYCAIIHARIKMCIISVTRYTTRVHTTCNSASVDTVEHPYTVVERSGCFIYLSHYTAVVIAISFDIAGVHTSADGCGEVGKTCYTTMVILSALYEAGVLTVDDTCAVCCTNDTAVPTRIAIGSYGTVVDTIFDSRAQRSTCYTADGVVTGNGTRNCDILHVSFLQHTKQAPQVGGSHIHGKIGYGVAVTVEMSAERIGIGSSYGSEGLGEGDVLGDTVVNACAGVTTVYRGSKGAQSGLVTDEVWVGLSTGSTAGDGYKQFCRKSRIRCATERTHVEFVVTACKSRAESERRSGCYKRTCSCTLGKACRAVFHTPLGLAAAGCPCKGVGSSGVGEVGNIGTVCILSNPTIPTVLTRPCGVCCRSICIINYFSVCGRIYSDNICICSTLNTNFKRITNRNVIIINYSNLACSLIQLHLPVQIVSTTA